MLQSKLNRLQVTDVHPFNHLTGSEKLQIALDMTELWLKYWHWHWHMKRECQYQVRCECRCDDVIVYCLLFIVLLLTASKLLSLVTNLLFHSRSVNGNLKCIPGMCIWYWLWGH